jgi:hypothetical protein
VLREAVGAAGFQLGELTGLGRRRGRDTLGHRRDDPSGG